MAFLDHRELKIIKGIGPIQGDVNSAEHIPTVINLMDTHSGIALDGTNGAWSPQIAAVKPLWAENPANDGRTLVSGALNNVTETMRLIITGSDATAVNSNLRRLYDMRQDVLDFWQAQFQVDPVYLKWWANCGVGPQFALIYTMDIAAEFMNSERPAIQVTLTIEREFGWRGIPPGASARQWSCYVNNRPFDISTFTLLYNSPYSLVQRTATQIFNRSEFSADYGSLVTQTAIPIPASFIPGDLPAKLILVYNTVSSIDRVFFAKRSISIKEYLSGKTTLIAANNTLNASDAAMSVSTSKVNDAGATKPAGGATPQRAEISFATAANSMRVKWNNIDVSRTNRLTGTWMVFMRCRQINGAAGDITMYLRYGNIISDDNDGIKLSVQSPQLVGAAGVSSLWGVNYMGLITIPIQNAKASVGKGGSGADSHSYGLLGGQSDLLDITLFAARSVGVGILYVCDLVLMPIDEGCFYLKQIGGVGAAGTDFVVDNTGYVTRGLPELTHGLIQGEGISGHCTELAGQEIELTPGTDNIIYTFTLNSNNQCSTNSNLWASVDIIPRWSGIRDA